MPGVAVRRLAGAASASSSRWAPGRCGPRYGKEDLFDHIPGKEESPGRRRRAGNAQATRPRTWSPHLVGKLACRADKSLTLLVAPTASLAGTVQVVARSVETALHKLHELKFDVTQVVSGYGVAPLPPVAPDELAAIGRTNDAILYGGRVTLWVRADDEHAGRGRAEGAVERRRTTTARRSPSCSSRYGRDFYKIDPHAVLPGGGRVPQPEDRPDVHRFGQPAPDVLRRSFEG